MLELRNLCAGYSKKPIISNININIPDSSITTIIGVNGCGKSTLLKSIIGLCNVIEGSIWINGTNIQTLTRQQIAGNIAYLAQGKNVPQITVQRMVLHGRFPYLTYPRHYSHQDINLANQAMETMGISQLKNKNLVELSGGTRQKVYIAMALCQQANIIMLDEPNTYLDINQQFKLNNILNHLKQQSKTIITVSHDLILALKNSDNIIVMDQGLVAMSGTPDEILKSGIIQDLFHVQINTFQNNGVEEYYYSHKEN